MNTTELNVIETAMRKTKSRQLYIRYHIIYLHLKGYKNVQIANIVPLTAQTIGTHVGTYKKYGLKGLIPRPRSGYPKKLSMIQEGFLMYILIHKNPSNLQFGPFMTWDCKLLCLWDKREFNILYSKSGMRYLLKCLGFSFTRSTYSLARASQVKQEAFKEEFKRLKKDLLNEAFDHLLFQDECSIRDYQSLINTWFPKGKQRVIPTYRNNKSVKLIGILNHETRRVYIQEEEQYTADIFLVFLENVLNEYLTRIIVLILDNARIHHAKLIQPFLEKHKNRLKLVSLLAYSPELNLIEGLWKWLKKSVIHNIFYKNVDEIRAAVQGFIQHINKRPLEVI